MSRNAESKCVDAAVDRIYDAVRMAVVCRLRPIPPAVSKVSAEEAARLTSRHKLDFPLNTNCTLQTSRVLNALLNPGTSMLVQKRHCYTININSGDSENAFLHCEEVLGGRKSHLRSEVWVALARYAAGDDVQAEVCWVLIGRQLKA